MSRSDRRAKAKVSKLATPSVSQRLSQAAVYIESINDAFVKTRNALGQAVALGEEISRERITERDLVLTSVCVKDRKKLEALFAAPQESATAVVEGVK